MFRPPVPIVTIVSSPKVGRLLQMYRGVHPVLAPEGFNQLESNEGVAGWWVVVR